MGQNSNPLIILIVISIIILLIVIGKYIYDYYIKKM